MDEWCILSMPSEVGVISKSAMSVKSASPIHVYKCVDTKLKRPVLMYMWVEYEVEPEGSDWSTHIWEAWTAGYKHSMFGQHACTLCQHLVQAWSSGV